MPTTWPSFFSHFLTDHRLGRPFLWPSTPSYTQKMWTNRPSRSLLLWLITARQSAMRACPSVMPAPSGRRLDGDHARVSAHVKLYLPFHPTHDAWRPPLAPLSAWVWLPMYNGLTLLIWTTPVHCGLVLPRRRKKKNLGLGIGLFTNAILGKQLQTCRKITVGKQDNRWQMFLKESELNFHSFVGEMVCKQFGNCWLKFQKESLEPAFAHYTHTHT